MTSVGARKQLVFILALEDPCLIVVVVPKPQESEELKKSCLGVQVGHC